MSRKIQLTDEQEMSQTEQQLLLWEYSAQIPTIPHIIITKFRTKWEQWWPLTIRFWKPTSNNKQGCQPNYEHKKYPNFSTILHNIIFT